MEKKVSFYFANFCYCAWSSGTHRKATRPRGGPTGLFGENRDGNAAQSAELIETPERVAEPKWLLITV